MTTFELKKIFKATPNEIYDAWLDSGKHSEMTGGEAVCSQKEKDPFSAWDGYIFGENKKLIINEEINQSWRTTEFKDSDKDSELIIKLKAVNEGTELTLIHNNIPEGQSDYEIGWEEHYFEPMALFFKK
jgi:activator of HSP90 ATPase